MASSACADYLTISPSPSMDFTLPCEPKAGHFPQGILSLRAAHCRNSIARPNTINPEKKPVAICNRKVFNVLIATRCIGSCHFEKEATFL